MFSGREPEIRREHVYGINTVKVTQSIDVYAHKRMELAVYLKATTFNSGTAHSNTFRQAIFLPCPLSPKKETKIERVREKKKSGVPPARPHLNDRRGENEVSADFTVRKPEKR